jgi:hypothetical protein
MLTYIALIYAIIFFFIHYFSKQITHKCRKHHTTIYSFIAGITITYIFLKLLPNIANGAVRYGHYLFIYPLLGFSLHHLAERHIYNHPSKKDRRIEFRNEHSLVFFLYHLVIGMILVSLVMREGFHSILFFIPLLFATIMTTLSLKEIHGKIRTNRNIKVLLSLSTLIGVTLALAFKILEPFNYAIYGFAGGTLLYVVVGESIPAEKKGSPLSFVIGAALYGLLLWPSF